MNPQRSSFRWKDLLASGVGRRDRSVSCRPRKRGVREPIIHSDRQAGEIRPSHPSLQLKFLMKFQTIASEDIVFATHNIGLARSVEEEVSPVATAPKGSEIKKIDETPRLAELLGELNYEGYQPLGFNKLFLDQGPGQA